MDALELTRRHFFSRASFGVGIAALGSLLRDDLVAAEGAPHFPAKAKRVIFLFQSGGPSQMDMFDYKPALEKLRATDLPASIGWDSGSRL